MRVADYIADFVHAQGVREVYMLSGTGSIHLDDAFARHPDLRFFCARHESAAAVMAVGNAKLSGRLGVAVVTTGPGGMNATAGVVEGFVDSVPLLVLSGQVERRHFAGTRTFGVQGFDVVAAAGAVTKHATCVTEPEAIGTELERALVCAFDGRPGPVWLDVPTDVQAAEVSLPAPPAAGGARRQAGAQDGSVADAELERLFDEAAALLRGAKRPLVIVGQGVRQAGAVVRFRELVDALGAPVVASRLAHDLLPYEHPRHLGQGGIRGRRHAVLAMRRADVVLSLGCSLAHALVGERFDYVAPDATVVMVDLDPAELAKPGVRVDMPIRADVGRAIDGLLTRWTAATVIAPDWSAWVAECQRRKRSLPTVGPGQRDDPINSYHLVERLEARTDARHVFVSDAGSAYYATGQALRFDRGQREVTSGAFASMGVALPLAIGAATSEPGVQAIVVTGDGSIETNIQELRAIAQYALDVKVFVVNNGGYASIRESQDAMCGGRYTDDQTVLDFARVGAAFGLPYTRIASCAALDAAIAELLAASGPQLVEVVCDPDQEMLRPLEVEPVQLPPLPA